jgi:hypothetical protein
MTQEKKIILLEDFIEQKVRKEQELEFYEKELAKLQEKMFWVKREIDLTNTIIRVIKDETVIDLVTQAESKLLIGDDNDDSS